MIDRLNVKVVVMAVAIALCMPVACAPRRYTWDGIPIDVTQNCSGETGGLVKRLTQEYTLLNPAVRFGDAGSDPIEGCTGGVVDISAISYELGPGPSRVIAGYLVARDGVAIIVHPSQIVSRLTSQQVTAVFTGQITNWREIGGCDAEIHAVVTEKYEEGFGANTDTAQGLVMGGAEAAKQAVYRLSAWGTPYEAARFTVAQDPYAIGFIPFGSLNDAVKALIIDDVPAIPLNVENGSYPYILPMYLLTRGPAKGLAKSFVDFCLSDAGQQVVRQEGYLRIEAH